LMLWTAAGHGLANARHGDLTKSHQIHTGGNGQSRDRPILAIDAIVRACRGPTEVSCLYLAAEQAAWEQQSLKPL
jgi:hypothetical protein